MGQFTLRRLIILLAGFAVTACAGNGGPTAEDLAPSLARVSGTACNRTVEGSAAVIGEGLMLTSAHVIAGVEGDLRVRNPGGSEASATVVGFDPNRDLALLAVEGSTGAAFRLGTAAAGDGGAIAAVDVDVEVTLIEFEVLRRILATGEDIYGEGDVARQALEIEADIASGISGAPLISRAGELIGVVFAESRTKGSSYAVYSSEIERFLAEVDLSTTVVSGRCK